MERIGLWILTTEPINVFFGVYKTDNAPIRLSYHGGVHYNSVVDPYKATIGVGLGLAEHKPGVRMCIYMYDVSLMRGFFFALKVVKDVCSCTPGVCVHINVHVRTLSVSMYTCGTFCSSCKSFSRCLRGGEAVSRP